MNRFLLDFKKGVWTLRYSISQKKVAQSPKLESVEDLKLWAKTHFPKCLFWHRINGSIGSLIDIEEWKKDCIEGFFIDYDGYGRLLTEDLEFGDYISPSQRHTLKDKPDYKYILWYNK